MPTREIKTRFTLEGESAYKKAMTDAANAIKVLNSEEKLAKAQFEQTGDAQAYAAEQTRILQEKIVQQKAAVEAAERAMQQLAQNGVSKNDRTYQNWATRLNTAKANLANLETQLGSVGTALDTTETEAGQTNSALEDIGKQVDYAAAISAIDSITATIEKGVKAAVKMGKALWDSSVDAGKWADNMATAASQAGLDVETYQSWLYASRFIDTNVSDITGSIDKLTKSLGSESEEAAKYFNQLRVATRNADGSVRNSTDVFWDVIDALGQVEDVTTRDIYAQQLLGRSYRALNPLVEAGSDAYKAMAEEGRQVAVVSADNVAALGKFDDAQQELNASLDKAKFDTLAALAPTMTEVSQAMNTAVQGFNTFLQSEQGQAALERLNGALSGVITAFLGEDSGQGTFESIVNGASGAIEAFTKGLEWIESHGDTVKGIIIALGAAYGGLKVGRAVLTFMQLLNAMPLSKLTSVFGGGADAASGAASGAANAASGAAGAGAAAAGGGILAKIGSAIAGAEAAGLVAAGVEAGVNMMKEVTEQGTFLGIGKENNFGLANAGFMPASEAETSLWEAIGSLFKGGESGSAKDAMGIPQAELDAVSAQFNQLPADAEKSGQDAAEALTGAITEGAPAAAEAGDGMAEGVRGPVRDLEIDFETFGANASIGLANGLAAESGLVYAEAWKMVEGVQSIMTRGLDIHSPSKVMMRFGEYIGQGLAEGIEDSTRQVERAAGRMSASVTRGVDRPAGSASAAAPGSAAQGGSAPGGQNTQGINATIVMDKTVVGRMVAPAVNAAIGAIVSSAR